LARRAEVDDTVNGVGINIGGVFNPIGLWHEGTATREMRLAAAFNMVALHEDATLAAVEDRFLTFNDGSDDVQLAYGLLTNTGNANLSAPTTPVAAPPAVIEVPGPSVGFVVNGSTVQTATLARTSLWTGIPIDLGDSVIESLYFNGTGPHAPSAGAAWFSHHTGNIWISLTVASTIGIKLDCGTTLTLNFTV